MKAIMGFCMACSWFAVVIASVIGQQNKIQTILKGLEPQPDLVTVGFLVIALAFTFAYAVVGEFDRS
jgi:hypothetical protein